MCTCPASDGIDSIVTSTFEPTGVYNANDGIFDYLLEPTQHLLPYDLLPFATRIVSAAVYSHCRLNLLPSTSSV